MSKDVDGGSLTRLFTYFLLLIGVVLSVGAMFSCEFMSYETEEGVDPAELPAPFFGNKSATVGLLRFEPLDQPMGCFAYWDTHNTGDYDLRSTEMGFAQSATGVLLILAFITAIIVTVEYCCISKCGWNKYIICFLLMLCTIFQGLTFMLFKAEEFCTDGRTCQMESGAALSIVATGLFFITGVAVLCAPAPTSTLCERLKSEKCCCDCKKRRKASRNAKKKAVMGSVDPDANEYEQGEEVEYEEDEVDEEKGDVNVVVAKTFEDESNEDDPKAADGGGKEDVDEEAPATEEAEGDGQEEAEGEGDEAVKASAVSTASPTEEGGEEEEATDDTPTEEKTEEDISQPPESTKFSSSLIAGSIPASSMNDEYHS